MEVAQIANSELILNDDGSVYHLNLLPGEIADTILLVGDPNRATIVSQYFDQIELCKRKREFVTYTGSIGKKRVSVIGTGMGAGNIDILINELDALVNIDFASRTVKPNHQALRLIRLGTCGGLSKNIPLNSLVISDFACGFDRVKGYD